MIAFQHFTRRVPNLKLAHACTHVLTHVSCPIFFFFRYDHQERLSAKEASAHPYFAPVREAAARNAATPGFPV
jgi:hypothetical protein